MLSNAGKSRSRFVAVSHPEGRDPTHLLVHDHRNVADDHVKQNIEHKSSFVQADAIAAITPDCPPAEREAIVREPNTG